VTRSGDGDRAVFGAELTATGTGRMRSRRRSRPLTVRSSSMGYS